MYMADGLLIPPPTAAFTTPAYDSALGSDMIYNHEESIEV